MEIDAKERRVTMSVGDFARFSTYPSRRESSHSGIWRAQAGQQWHSEIQAQSDARQEGMQNEVSTRGRIDWGQWTIALNGRIDQLKSDDRTLHIREIKTISKPLPLASDFIESHYRHYILQLLAYGELRLRNATPPPTQTKRELLLVELQTGLTQSFVFGSEYDSLLVDHLDQLCSWLEAKRERVERLQHLKFNRAYEVPRPGQETIQEDLAAAFEHNSIACLEAPTGYGKTGVAWEFALGQLAQGAGDRIIYLTSKTTGQIEAKNRLQSLVAHDHSFSFWHIRNKQEHCINHEFRCSSAACPYIANLEDNWKQQGLDRLYMFSNDHLDLDQIKEIGRQSTVCPYEIMRAGLSSRDAWIADYNYLFAPQSRGLLESQADFDPARTFLIIDEAHNLASRVRSSYSLSLSSQAANSALAELDNQHASARIRNLLTGLIDFAILFDSGDTLGPNALEELFDIFLSISDFLNNEPLDYDGLSDSTNDLLWSLVEANRNWHEGELPYTGWVRQKGCIELSCLDASPVIRSALQPFGRVLMLSATLSPYQGFLDECGLETLIPTPAHLTPPAPWRDSAYDVAIDTRADTRGKGREGSKATTAKTVCELCQNHGPTVVFFPSYAYARMIKQAVEQNYPFIRITLQESGGTLQEREQYLVEALQFNDAVFLILGSSFAEGIDALGGRIKTAMIVSPALPEVNPLRDAEMEHAKRRGFNTFERVYLEPGIKKVNQALGRLIRAPDQRVKALLHCYRFAQPQTKRLLDPAYQQATILFKDEDLENWLKRK